MPSPIRSRNSHARGPRRVRSITSAFSRIATSSSGGGGAASVRNCQFMLWRRLESTRTKPLSESTTASRMGPEWEVKMPRRCSGPHPPSSQHESRDRAPRTRGRFTVLHARETGIAFAAVEAMLQPDAVITARSLQIRRGDHAVRLESRPLLLTHRELQLLAADRHPRRSLSGRSRTVALSGPPTCMCANCAQSSRRSHPDGAFIHTHFGFGYRFAPERLSQIFHTRATAR